MIKAVKLSVCLYGKRKGFDERAPLSLPKATIEPEKVMAPINIPRYISTRWMVYSAPTKSCLFLPHCQ